MQSDADMENFIAKKRLEIEREKSLMGVSPTQHEENKHIKRNKEKNFSVLGENNQSLGNSLARNHAARSEEKEEEYDASGEDRENEITPDLERYIRRYLGLPMMLKAGEYSPNNPLVRGERPAGDALLGLGEYERRRNTLRKLRQQQYREYLDQQAKKKQEAKEQAEKERREREKRERELEEREREREEREREKELEDREKARFRRECEERAREQKEQERRLIERRSPERRRNSVNYAYNRVDTGVQVDSVATPLSVAVQTDDVDLYQMQSSKYKLTQAERELSPHTVVETREDSPITRRRSCGDDRLILKKSNREKLASDLRHSYRPSIFDADAIQQRNAQAEKEAAARRQFYQQELRNQILEQQRLREERKTREKMLEQAEMRRLEEQLRMLRAAQEEERSHALHTDRAMKRESMEFEKTRNELQDDIDIEQRKLRLAPKLSQSPNRIESSRDKDAKLPFFYPRVQESELGNETEFEKERDLERGRKPFSTNIPDDSIFSKNYDVDSYLRRNLNFKEKYENFERYRKYEDDTVANKTEKEIKKAPVHDPLDSLPIPVLRHSPLLQTSKVDNTDVSEAMKKVEGKWKIPAVQKNILKSIPNESGKNVSILTQLGSIRRQLQLEQLKLDKLAAEDV